MAAKRTALVVDDEPDIVGILKKMLEAEGYEVLCGNDGLEVFDLLKQRRPDILIIDRIMPGMGGMEVIARLKESPETASIPIIMLTSMGKFDDVSEGYKQGADGYITKPFTRNQIINGINLVLASRAAPAPEELQAHALAFLRACAKLSQRTEELARRFAAEQSLSPNDWAYQGLERRLWTDQDQAGALREEPDWQCCFRGWGVDFQNAKTGERADLAIGPGGRCDTFDEWRVQSFIQNQARRRVDFIALNALLEKHNDAARLLMEHLARQGWIEPAAAAAEITRESIDAQLGDRWVISQKGSKALAQT